MTDDQIESSRFPNVTIYIEGNPVIHGHIWSVKRQPDGVFTITGLDLQDITGLSPRTAIDWDLGNPPVP